jgi:VIT1/CCC1 family predicted Fe2+/Mn2+ transporter
MLKTSLRVLDPAERISEVLFGLIMVLTFTGSLSVADAGRDDVRAMLIGALGCNLAWGIIDGILYVMGSLAERGRNLRTYLAVRDAADPGKARKLIADALPSVVASVVEPAELDSLHERLVQLPEPPKRARVSGEDCLGAVGVFLLVFLSTFPVTVPFMLMDGVQQAMRTSNAIAVALLFVCGFAYGRYIGRSAWGFGASMVVLGTVLVALTIALGG